MSAVNVPLLRKAVEWAEAEAAKPRELSEWEQGSYCIPAEQLHVLGKASDCGTCYCIAGYVAQAIDARYADDYRVDGVHVSAFAADALGIPREDAQTYDRHLFSGSNSIEDVRRIAEDLAGERL